MTQSRPLDLAQGMSRNSTVATIDPTRMYGRRRPSRVRVRSLNAPRNGSSTMARMLSMVMIQPVTMPLRW